jgi:hypothetical protein
MILTKATLVGAAGAVLALATVAPALAASVDPVSTTPASFTPWLPSTAPGQYVQQLAQCGDTMYAVGKVTTVQQGATTYTRGNGFSFSATNGTVTGWDPQVTGTVSSIALSDDCSTAYLGGYFTSVGATPVHNIAAVNTATGAIIPGFGHTANNQVQTVQYSNGRVLVGGQFTTIDGKARSHLASLNPTTGTPTTYADIPFTGGYPGSTATRIYNSQLNHTGTKMLVEGVFTSIAGQPRQQIAMLDLGATAVTLDAWAPVGFDQQCRANSDFYTKGANWSPDDATVYVATTGYKPVSGPGSSNSDPRAGLCDAAIAFPAVSAPVSYTWINYTGCDSLFDVVADTNDVYFGGHERFANNADGCDAAGPSAVSRPGIGDISANGAMMGLATSWNPTRTRGHGVNDLVLTGAGLWIASDNGKTSGASQKCGNVSNHGGICFLPN